MMTTGRVGLAQQRKHAGLSQEDLAGQLGVARSTVRRWECGTTTPRPGLRPRLARELMISLDTLADLLKDTSGVIPDPPAPLVILDQADTHLAAMQSLRAADVQTGGGHLYAAMVNYLHTKVAPCLFGSSPGPGGSLMFTAAAGLTEMAGWMAHDAGHDDLAGQHFARSLDLARLGIDTQLLAHVLASMSHLAHHQGRPTEAIGLAEQGHRLLESQPYQPELTARLFTMQAKGHALMNRPVECTRLLQAAEQALDRPPDIPRSDWISRFDTGSMAMEAARCMQHLGRWAQVQAHAELVISVRPPTRIRSRAMGQLLLAMAYAAQSHPEHACDITGNVLTATAPLNSSVVLQHLQELRPRLQPYGRNRAVAALLPELDHALQVRSGQHGALPGSGMRGLTA